ncbi:MAG: hypothetical protein V1846_00340 [Candidatus Komeilibacteria bacterium]
MKSKKIGNISPPSKLRYLYSLIIIGGSCFAFLFYNESISHFDLSLAGAAFILGALYFLGIINIIFLILSVMSKQKGKPYHLAFAICLVLLIIFFMQCLNQIRDFKNIAIKSDNDKEEYINASISADKASLLSDCNGMQQYSQEIWQRCINRTLSNKSQLTECKDQVGNSEGMNYSNNLNDATKGAPLYVYCYGALALNQNNPSICDQLSVKGSDNNQNVQYCRWYYSNYHEK